VAPDLGGQHDPAFRGNRGFHARKIAGRSLTWKPFVLEQPDVTRSMRKKSRGGVGRVTAHSSWG
jgi:hypothetical protein